MKQTLRLLLVGGLCSVSLHAAFSSFLTYLPKVERGSGSVTVSVRVPSPPRELLLYYRVEGIRGYQVRQMRPGEDGVLTCRLRTDTLAGKNLEYFLKENRAGKGAVSPTFTIVNAGPGGMPDIYFQETPEPQPEPETVRDPFIRVGGSFSAAGRLYQKEDDGADTFTASGNLRIYRNIVKEDGQIDFDSNFAYTNQASAETKHLDLTSMLFRLKRGSNQFEMGDLAINHSEYSTAYLNRRGMRYEMEGKKIYLSSFFTNSQQKSGFEGFGIPSTNAGLFGAVAGANLGPAFKLRGIFLTGHDNLESKTVVSSENPNRKGSVVSVWGDLSLFQSALQLGGEYASSNFGSAAADEQVTKLQDHAYRGSLSFNKGIISSSVNYRWIGQNFNSIANLFLQNDRQGLDSTITLSIKQFSLTAGYTDQKSYLHSLVQDAQKQKRFNTGLNWLIGSHLRVGGEFSKDSLDYDTSTGLPTSNTGMDTTNASGSLGYIAGSTNVTVTLTKTTSKNFSSNFSGQLSASFRFGQAVSLAPIVSYQENEDHSSHQTSKIYNANLNGEITFVPQWFALTFNGAYTRNRSDTYDSTAFSLNGNLNLYLSRLFNGKIQPALSAKSQYQSNEASGTKTTNFAFWMQFDISF